MKAIIPLVALAIQVATAQSPDSAVVPAASEPRTVSVQIDSLPSAAALPVVPAPAASSPVAAAPVAAAPVGLAPVAVAPTRAEPGPAEPAAPRAGIVGTYGDWQLGFGAGLASGSGFSVRKWFGEKDAVQLNLAPYVSRSNYPEDGQAATGGPLQDSGFVLEADITVGLTWLHELYNYRMDRDRELKLLSYLAGSAYLSVEQQQMNRWRPLESGKRAEDTTRVQGTDYGLYFDDYRRDERNFRLGGGAVTEFSIWRFSAMLGLGLGGWYETISENFGISGDIQAGAHFRF